MRSRDVLTSIMISFALLAFIMTLPGCFLFDVRSPRQEADTLVVPWVSPYSCVAVLQNIKTALEANSPGVTNYMNSLSSSFIFHPDNTDSITFLSSEGWDGFKDWTPDVERKTIESFLNGAQSVTVGWVVQLRTTSDSDSLYELSYTLRVNRSTGLTDYGGLARIYFREEAGFYKIVRWDDSRGSSVGTPTWGWLKAKERRATSR